MKVNKDFMNMIFNSYLTYISLSMVRYEKCFDVVFRMISDINSKMIQEGGGVHDQTIIDLLIILNNTFDSQKNFNIENLRKYGLTQLKNVVLNTPSDIKQKLEEIDSIFARENFFCYEESTERDIFESE